MAKGTKGQRHPETGVDWSRDSSYFNYFAFIRLYFLAAVKYGISSCFVSYCQNDSHQNVSCAALEFSTRSFIVRLASISFRFCSVTTVNVASAPLVLEFVIKQPVSGSPRALSHPMDLVLLTPILLTKSQPYGSATPICMIGVKCPQ